MDICCGRRAVVTRFRSVEVFTVLLVVALVGISHADEGRDPPPVHARPESLLLKVVRSDNGDPVREARVVVRFHSDQQTISHDVITDNDGGVAFDYPEGNQPVFGRVRVSHPGLFSNYIDFDQELNESSLPGEITIRMEPGKTIGGKVVDPDGNPVGGAQLSIDVPAADTNSRIRYLLRPKRTADDGTWQFDEAPLKLSGLQVSIDHPRFLLSSQPLQDRVDGRYELDPGLTLTGRVLDQTGKPVAGAQVTVGPYRLGRTAAVVQDGTYSVAALSPESTFVTVESPGYAPQVESVVVTKDANPVNFELQPGRSTRFRVTDVNGMPLPGIRVVADKWKGIRSLRWQATTDAEGFATWTGAPTDAVEFQMMGQGYVTRRDIVAAPQDEPHTIVLRQPSKLELIVTGPDKQKVFGFHLKTGHKYDGRDEIFWMPHDFVGRNGNFEIESHDVGDEMFLRIEAKGFQPWTSSAIPLTDGPRKLFVRLVAGSGPAGIVRLPNGNPAVGTQVVLVSGQSIVHLQDGHRARGGKQTVIADDEGRFEFTPVEESYSLIALHNDGFAEVNAQDLTRAGGIDLQPWARLEVTVRRHGNLLVGAKVVIDPARPTRERNQIYGFGLAGITNEEGKVIFERVPPRAVNISLPLEQALSRNPSRYLERSATVSLTPGNTAQVTLGGTGAVVRGKLNVTGKPPAQHRWEFNEAVTMTTSRAGNPAISDASDCYRALIASDGSFRINDIPPGRYELHVNLTPVPDANGNARQVYLGSITRGFQVGKDQVEVDLGIIDGEWSTLLGIGDMAPLFVAEGLNCGTVRVGDLRGRLLLLDFWDSTSTAWIAELPELQKLHQEFVGDTRFQLVGLSMDSRSMRAIKALKQREIPWNCAFVGSIGLGPLRFQVKVPPEKFLIDVNGKILYRGRDLDAVGKLIRDRLAELPEEVARPGLPVGILPVTIDDDFEGATPIAVAASVSVTRSRDGNTIGSARTETMLWSNDGTLIRTVAGFGPQQWLARSTQMAFDPSHDRCYFCNTSKQILAMNRMGRRLFCSDVPELHAAAVDELTGEVWCLALQGLGNGELVILDSNGWEKTRHPIAGFDIAFSILDDAFWIAGNGLLKVKRNGEVVIRHPLPEGGITFAGLAIDHQRGGAWCLELRRQNDERRLWKIAPDGTATPGHRFPPQTYPDGIICVDGSVWLTVFQRDADAPAGIPRGKREIQRFGKDGMFIDSLPIPAVEITISPQTGTIWASDGEQILKIERDGKRLQSIPLEGKSPGIRLGVF